MGSWVGSTYWVISDHVIQLYVAAVQSLDVYYQEFLGNDKAIVKEVRLLLKR